MTLGSQLSTLESYDLIRLARAQPELEYIFRHALVQDAAYSSLLRQDRRRLHLAVGECLERLYADRLDELAPVLGLHFNEAADARRALKYYKIAARRAAGQYANIEAVEHYTRALELGAQSEMDRELFTQLYLERGRVFELSGRYDEALANYREMEKAGSERGDRSLELSALTARMSLHSTPTAKYDLSQAQILADQTLALARRLGDREAEAKVLWNRMLLEMFAGNLEEATRSGERSIELSRELNLREQLAYSLNDIFRVYLAAGQAARGLTALEEARELWRELGNLPMLADSIASANLVYFFTGEFEKATAFSQEAYRLSEVTGNLWGQSYSVMMTGAIYWERGEPASAIKTMEECIQLGEKAGFVVPGVSVRAELAMVYGTLGAIETGLELAHLAVEIGRERQYHLELPQAQTALAELHLLKGDIAEAEVLIEEALTFYGEGNAFWNYRLPIAQAELALAKRDHERVLQVMDDFLALLDRSGARTLAGDCLHLKGKALLEMGRADEGWAALREAHQQAEALGSRRTLWAISSDLARIEARHGDSARAESLRGQAHETIRYIAGHTGSRKLRTSFLSLPQVREVLGS